MLSPRHDKAHETWDVVIIGAGPAGTATAITLARLGQRVLLVEERVTVSFKLGESLPPSSIDLVRQFLGDLDDHEQVLPGLFKTAGNISSWITDQPEVADFFVTPPGFGLCIDRLAFDEALRSNAVALGVTLLKGVRFQACERIDDSVANWHLTLVSQTKTQQYRTRFLVDCSGRRAAVARALGVPIHNYDQLFAYAQWYSSPDPDDDRYTRIEAMPHGWWYSNRLPGNTPNETRRLVIFLSDKDLPEAKMAAHSQGFEQLLRKSTHIGPLLSARGYIACGAIRGAPASSQRLADFSGRTWMAVGDAAQAYDPLSSQGIDKALRSGSHAGYMIHYALTEDSKNTAEDERSTYLQQYAAQQEELWQTYLSQHDYFYQIQPRWPDHPFWQRRQTAPHTTPSPVR